MAIVAKSRRPATTGSCRGLDGWLRIEELSRTRRRRELPEAGNIRNVLVWGQKRSSRPARSRAASCRPSSAKAGPHASHWPRVDSSDAIFPDERLEMQSMRGLPGCMTGEAERLMASSLLISGTSTINVDGPSGWKISWLPAASTHAAVN